MLRKGKAAFAALLQPHLHPQLFQHLPVLALVGALVGVPQHIAVRVDDDLLDIRLAVLATLHLLYDLLHVILSYLLMTLRPPRGPPWALRPPNT